MKFIETAKDKLTYLPLPTDTPPRWMTFAVFHPQFKPKPLKQAPNDADS